MAAKSTFASQLRADLVPRNEITIFWLVESTATKPVTSVIRELHDDQRGLVAGWGRDLTFGTRWK